MRIRTHNIRFPASNTSCLILPAPLAGCYKITDQLGGGSFTIWSSSIHCNYLDYFLRFLFSIREHLACLEAKFLKYCGNDNVDGCKKSDTSILQRILFMNCYTYKSEGI